MKPSLEREIRERIDAFLSEIRALVREQALAAVREALGDDRASSRASRRVAGPAGSAAKRPRRKAPPSRATVRPQARRPAAEPSPGAVVPVVEPAREPERFVEPDDIGAAELEPAGAPGAE